MGEVTRESILNAAKEAFRKEGKPVSKAEFKRLTGITDRHIYRFFPEGGWSEVVEAANLPEDPRYHKRISDEDLLAQYHEVTSALGSIPTWARFESRARISAAVIGRRFGGLRGTLERYRVWLEEHEPTSPLLPIVAARCRPGPVVPPTVGRRSRSAPQWRKVPGLEYGAPINFRGLRHAPINEQGVVYLFGMVSRDLDILVEAIHESYPDCEAKRRVDRRLDRWQPVRIEFEYRSSSFREHGHDPKQCDLVVCWEHDWPDCPIEVIELRSVIADLQE